jgi:hypothetical protein
MVTIVVFKAIQGLLDIKAEKRQEHFLNKNLNENLKIRTKT